MVYLAAEDTSLIILDSAALCFAKYFAFGDSLTDTGNGIGAFPQQFAQAELDPNGQTFPMHAADRFSDGKLLIDFLVQESAETMDDTTAGDMKHQ